MPLAGRLGGGRKYERAHTLPATPAANLAALHYHTLACPPPTLTSAPSRLPSPSLALTTSARTTRVLASCAPGPSTSTA